MKYFEISNWRNECAVIKSHDHKIHLREIHKIHQYIKKMNEIHDLKNEFLFLCSQNLIRFDKKRRINICRHKKIITNHHNRKNLYGAHMYAFATYITLNQLMRILVFIYRQGILTLTVELQPLLTFFHVICGNEGWGVATL